jgi:predicted transposase/invertase (TIGR01784 family)
LRWLEKLHGEYQQWIESTRHKVDFDSVEVKETSFRLDGVFLPPNPDGIVYFCEVQFQLDGLLYERMLSEISIYVYRHRYLFADWRAVVIYWDFSSNQSQTKPKLAL